QSQLELMSAITAIDEMRVAIDQSRRHPASHEIVDFAGDCALVARHVGHGAEPGDAAVPDGNRGVLDRAIGHAVRTHGREAAVRPQAVPGRRIAAHGGRWHEASVVSATLWSYCRRPDPSTASCDIAVNTLFAASALLPDGWAADVLFEIGPDGSLTGVTPNATAHPAAASAPRAAGPVVPGMPNLHSHAFQRAMAGLTEQVGQGGSGGDDSFWTWRQVMYGFVGRLMPDQVQAIAAQLYVEMLKAGYTAVGEFHYLHHDPDGRPYADLAEMSERIVAAAQATGIGLTHLPVLYGYGGFGGQPAGSGQRRFLNDVDGFLRLINRLLQRHRKNPQVRIGIAPHSLRAVTAEMLKAAVAGLDSFDDEAPIHIHIAEQVKEVQDCRAWSNQRPVEWLLHHQPVGPRWCLVHATHMTEGETARLARTGAVAGLCPTTEGNLGDGFFQAPEF